MKYLAFDASTEACSVAINLDGKITSRFEICPQSHSLVLLPMIDELLQETGCKLTDLDALFFAQGPGSFTGVRIGVGVAQGLGYSTKLPMVGISTMKIMAQQAFEELQEKQVIVTIDARMAEIYTGVYAADEQGVMQAVIAESVIAPELLAERLATAELENNQQAYGVGTGWDAYSTLLMPLKSTQSSPDILYPNAKYMFAIGEQAMKQGKTVTAENAQPVYVRDTVSWKKLPGRE